PVRLVDASGREVGRHALALDLRAELASSGDEWVVDPLAIRVDDKGTIALTGRWPQSKQAPRDGRVMVKVRGLDARTWGEMYGYVAPGSVKTLPLDADLTIEHPRGGAITTITGSERLGPFTAALDAKRRTSPVTLRVEHRGAMGKDAMEGLAITLT